MALYTGTATDRTDLLGKIQAHVEDFGWTVLESDITNPVTPEEPPSEPVVFFKGGQSYGPYFYIRSRFDALPPDFEVEYGFLEFRAFHVFNGSRFNTSSQPGTSTRFYLTLGSGSIPYWLFINKRRLVLVVNISGRYCAAYVGLYFPFATSKELPYPLFISANVTNTSILFDNETNSNANFWDMDICKCNLKTKLSSSFTWVTMNNNAYYLRKDTFDSYFYVKRDSQFYAIAPLDFRHSDGFILGELDGAFSVLNPDGLVSEDTLNYGSKDYVVFRNVFRETKTDFVAIEV